MENYFKAIFVSLALMLCYLQICVCLLVSLHPFVYQMGKLWEGCLFISDIAFEKNEIINVTSNALSHIDKNDTLLNLGFLEGSPNVQRNVQEWKSH